MNTKQRRRFTEILDKHRKRIYEGDLVRIKDGKKKAVITRVWYLSPCWHMSVQKPGQKVGGSFHMGDFGNGEIVDEFELIGKSEDYPELLSL